MSLLPGARLGPYEISAMLGAGGMGVVYRARDTKLDRDVAVKVLPEALAEDTETLKRFEREAKAVAALSHPNILSIFDFGSDRGQAYAVTELLEGETLRDRLKDGPIPVAETLALALQIAKGLCAAHGKEIVHRDLKPENLFLCRDGLLKILDFGLVRWTRRASGTATELPTEEMGTIPGTVMGTLAYMSPEQVRGQTVDHRSDLFSFGAILHEALSGRAAFKRDSTADTISAILDSEPHDLDHALVPDRLREIIGRLLEKDVAKRYSTAEEVLADLAAVERSLTARPRARLSRRIQIAVAALVAVAAALAGWLLLRERRVRWARHELIPKAEQLLGEARGLENYQAIFALAVEAEKIVPGDPRLAVIFGTVAASTTFTSEPAGAVVSIRPYADPNAPWRTLGTTPIQSVRLPASVFVVRFEKPGYETVLAAAPTFERNFAIRQPAPATIRRILDPTGTLPPGMVRVTGQRDLPDYFVDTTEVTNRAYKEFIDAGGYRTKEYWKELLESEGRARGWPGAVSAFVDETGRPGPATWQAGDYPEGRESYPVSGVSWYEAVAFSAWAGKSLPTSRHWEAAAGIPVSGTGVLTWQLSNFGGAGPVPVGSRPGLSAFGARDMAGNVREWCWNSVLDGRVVRGGAWNDASYMASNVSRAAPLDRSPKNGLRCVKYVDRAAIPASAFEPVRPGIVRPDFTRQKPPTEDVFRVYRQQFAYDRADLGAVVEWRNTSSPHWVQEKVTFNAAYDGERMIAYLFLPTRGKPPYQTVVYFPGSGSVYQRSSRDLETYREFELNLAHFLKAGRAVVYPVYKRTFERGTDALVRGHAGAQTHQYTDLFIKIVKDLSRTLDYIETRPDLDRDRVAYLGFSWGAMYGSIIPAVEDRLKVSMLILGGMDGTALPEVQEINYVGHVTIPTLMLNGRYDFRFPYESSAKAMFDLLGTPSDKKVQKLYDVDHFVPRNEVVKETLAWLDKYLGPVQ